LRRDEIQQERGDALVIVNMENVIVTKSSVTAAPTDVNLLHKMDPREEGRECRGRGTP
jgi:hypothetical protein